MFFISFEGVRSKVLKVLNTMNNWSKAMYVKGIEDVKYYE